MRQRLYPSAMAPRPCPATREWRAEKEPPSTPRAAACSGTSAVSLLPILGCMADHDYIQVIQWAHTIAYTTTQCVSMAIVSAARRGMARRDGSRAGALEARPCAQLGRAGRDRRWLRGVGIVRHLRLLAVAHPIAPHHPLLARAQL